MEEEHKRQNARISEMEEGIKETRSLASSVERLAYSMERMLKEQEKQGERLQVLENRDGEMWRKVAAYVITATIGIIIGYIFTQLGMK